MCVGFTTGKLEKRKVGIDLQVVHVLPNGSQSVIAKVAAQFKTAAPIIEEIRCNTTELD
jgi:hypothetical protein